MAEPSHNVIHLETPPNQPPRLRLGGSWSVEHPLPDIPRLMERLPAAENLVVEIDGHNIRRWDSALPTALWQLHAALRRRRMEFHLSGLPDGAMRLVTLAEAAAEATVRPARPGQNWLGQLGQAATAWASQAIGLVDFVGALTLALIKLPLRRAHLRSVDFWLAVEQSGAKALPIAGVIAVLMGMIFAFVGSIQLRRFGAEIYVANLVVVAMSREMGAVMTAIILAGRTGAAFAAQIGAMQGNEEIDALTTLGIPPMEFLVVPRVAALVLMTPLLCLYADALGAVGGVLVGASLPNMNPAAFIHQMSMAARWTDITIGVVKSCVFGIIVAVAGCRAGMDAGRSASGVGEAATTAMVSSILGIIIADAVFAVLLNILGL